MTLTWHIIRKDLRLLRWVLLPWLALSLIDAVDRIVAPRFVSQDERWMFVLPMWVFLISTAYALVLLLFVANHIQAERLVGTTAFWLTRPIPRGMLLRSKLLGLSLFLILPTLTIEALLMAAFQVPALTIALALLQQAWTMAVLLLVLAFGATLTATAVRLLFLIVAVLVALYLALMVVAALSLSHRILQPEPPTGPTDPSPFVIGLTIFGIGVLTAIWHHYTRRRHGIATLIFLASGAIAWATLGLWARVSLFGGTPTLAQEPWARDPSVSRLRLRSDERMASEMQRPAFGRFALRTMKSIAAPVVLEGIPEQFSAQPFTMEAQVRFPDGHVVRSERVGAHPQQMPIAPGVSAPRPRDYVLDELWPTLMMAPIEEYQRDGDRTGVYTGTFHYTIERHDTLATVPLVVGAAYKDGPRSVLVTDVQYRFDSCLATFRTSVVSLLGHSPTRPALVTRFRHREGIELKDQFGDGRIMAVHVSSMSAGMMFFFTPHPLQQLDVAYRGSKVVYPIFDQAHATGPPCEEINLVVERTTYAGSLTRTLELRDFRLNDPRPAGGARP